jgi:hypothetical protein
MNTGMAINKTAMAIPEIRIDLFFPETRIHAIGHINKNSGISPKFSPPPCLRVILCASAHGNVKSSGSDHLQQDSVLLIGPSPINAALIFSDNNPFLFDFLEKMMNRDVQGCADFPKRADGRIYNPPFDLGQKAGTIHVMGAFNIYHIRL